MTYKLISNRYIKQYKLPVTSMEQSFKNLDELYDVLIELDYDYDEYKIYKNGKIFSTNFRRKNKEGLD